MNAKINRKPSVRREFSESKAAKDHITTRRAFVNSMKQRIATEKAALEREAIRAAEADPTKRDETSPTTPRMTVIQLGSEMLKIEGAIRIALEALLHNGSSSIRQVDFTNYFYQFLQLITDAVTALLDEMNNRDSKIRTIPNAEYDWYMQLRRVQAAIWGASELYLDNHDLTVGQLELADRVIHLLELAESTAKSINEEIDRTTDAVKQ